MDIGVLSNLLREKGWQVGKKCQEHCLFEHAHYQKMPVLITPDPGSGLVPAGTLNAIVRLAHSRKEMLPWTSAISDAKSITVILEKQSDDLWGRIEAPGLLIATYGYSATNIIDRLRALLIEFAIEADALHCCSALASIPFIPLYDTTAVWSVVRQLKATHIAEQAGIDIELVGQFMTGNSHPCSEVATRLENSIHELGRQLLQISIR